MAFFDEYTAAMEEYVDRYVQLEIVNVTYDGDEQGQFDVRITNTGPLDMLDVDIRFTGLNGTTVKGGGALQQFGAAWIYKGFIDRIGCHGNASSVLLGASTNGADLTRNLYFLAPQEASLTPSPQADLVEVSVDNWYADFDHIHRSHSRGGAGAILQRRVVRSVGC